MGLYAIRLLRKRPPPADGETIVLWILAGCSVALVILPWAGLLVFLTAVVLGGMAH